MAVQRFHAELGMALGTGLLGVAGIVGALELGTGWSSSGPDSGYFPFYISLILIGASLWNLVSALRQRAQGGALAARLAETFIERDGLIRIGTFFAEMVAFVIVTMLLGIYISGTLYLAWSAARHGGYRWTTAIAILSLIHI